MGGSVEVPREGSRPKKLIVVVRGVESVVDDACYLPGCHDKSFACSHGNMTQRGDADLDVDLW